MKIAKTQNISQYDDRLRFRLDARTLRCLLVSAGLFLALFFALRPLLGWNALPVGIGAAAIVAAVQLAVVDGLTGTEFFRLWLVFLLFPNRRRLPYAHRPEDYRIDPEGLK